MEVENQLKILLTEEEQKKRIEESEFWSNLIKNSLRPGVNNYYDEYSYGF